MDPSGLSKPVERAQSSIRSFFQPRPANNITPRPTSLNYTPRPVLEPPSTPAVIPYLPTIASTSPQDIASATPPPASIRLPPQATISKIDSKHVQPLKRINTLLLPINYPDSFYRMIVDPQISPNFSRAILWQDTSPKSDFGDNLDPKVVGGIVCRLDRDEVTKTSAIYIQSLALLSPYRRYGLATAALDNVVESLVTLPVTEFPVMSLYAHVWTENTEGLEWYMARGFVQEKFVIQDYYSRLKPGSAWVLRKSIGPIDHLRHVTHNGNETAVLNNNAVSLQLSAFPTGSGSGSGLAPGLSVVPPKLSPNEVRPSAATSRVSSFQNSGPGHEWNDLPEEILKPSSSSSSLQRTLSAHLMPPGDEIDTRSRSSSRSRTGDKSKKKRLYPAAAFGAGIPST